MSTTETDGPSAPPPEKIQRLSFYGYSHYQAADGRYLGEDRAGSNSFYVFESKEAFEDAVSAYNVVGRVPVKSASSGRA